MPNEVDSILSFRSGSCEAVRNFLKNYSSVSDRIEIECFTMDNYHHIRFSTSWKPLMPCDLSEEKGFPKLDHIKLAWSEPGLLGYGWWRKDGNHTESHTYDDPEMDDGGEPMGDYLKFIKETHLFQILE